MASQRSASMRPDDYVEGGGLLDNEDVVWKEVRFVMWDYEGKVTADVPALKVSMEVKESGDEVTQHYSVGKATDWEPSEDGKQLVAIGNAMGINKNSNMAVLINSLIQAGYPVEKIGDDCTVFEGLDCHMIRVAAPKRPGLVTQPRADGREYVATVLVVDSINAMPGEGGKGGKAKGGKGGKGEKEKVEEEAEGNEIEEKAEAAVMEVLGGETKPISKKQLAAKVHGLLKGDSDRGEVVKMVYDDEFLGEKGPWAYDRKKGTVSMG